MSASQSVSFMSTFAKMSAKLVVHKFESGVNQKSLQISINDSDNDSSNARYCGEWTAGWAHKKKKFNERSSRLVVKVVSGYEPNTLDLDSCSVKIGDPRNVLINTNETVFKQRDNSLQLHQEQGEKLSTSSNTFATFNHCTGSETAGIQRAPYEYQPESADTTIAGNTETCLSPLEHRLEKVRENNARIMENIHMLNRTLDYTKKKEILDVVCPKSTRFPCLTCGKCFVYETGLKRHCSMRHVNLGSQTRWQVVWTCIECFQVWPQQDLAVAHAKLCCNLETTELVREIKTSSLLQCEFCDKVYTSIPRLQKHSKLHTTARNYECNACQSTFQSYKAAELHWLLCPWLKMYYSFSLPKMWLCHVCDRKFKNYEQLYNHRYKVGHYMAKYSFEVDNTLGLVTYQCELCGQWYHNIPLLQDHRRTKHPACHSVLQNRKESQPSTSELSNEALQEETDYEEVKNVQYSYL